MSTPRRAAVYTRISLDTEGHSLAVTRQQEDAQTLAQQRGWTVVGVWSDNSISASDARKQRPGYDALTQAYKAGTFDALICYDLDRLTRQPRQLEDWIDAAEQHGLALVTTNGEADLTTDAGRLFARIKLAVARAEIERKSARQKRAALQRAQQGKTHAGGRRLFGYSLDNTIIDTEAEVVRGLYQRFDNGESIRGLTRWLNESGVPTRFGGPWRAQSVRHILTNPRYAGQRNYQGTITEGTWEPIIDRDLHRAVQTRLSDPRRRLAYGTDRNKLGSGLYLCAECGDTLTSNTRDGYGCRNKCLYRRCTPIDQFVVETIAARLARDDLHTLLTPTVDDTKITRLRDTQARLQRRLDQIGHDYDAGLIDGLRYKTAGDKIRADMDRVTRDIAAMRGSTALTAMLTTPDPAQAFRTASLMMQREVIATLCTVTVHRSPRGRQGFDPSTVTITPT